jgi:hypothetical protein
VIAFLAAWTVAATVLGVILGTAMHATGTALDRRLRTMDRDNCTWRRTYNGAWVRLSGSVEDLETRIARLEAARAIYSETYSTN